jgi:isocitrate dehydrogenase (NAD+)
VAYRVTFIPGDGTGPEISEAVRRVLEGTGVEFEWDWQDAGADVYEQEGTPLPDRVLESIKERGLAIKGPITTPVGSGFRCARRSTSTRASARARPTRACARASPRPTW